MGDLYAKAGATGAATEAARRRLERVLVRDAGVPTRTVEAGPEAVVKALEARLGGSWEGVAEHLRTAHAAAEVDLRPGSALKLVQALGADAQRVQQAAMPGKAAGKRTSQAGAATPRQGVGEAGEDK